VLERVEMAVSGGAKFTRVKDLLVQQELLFF